jgi:hypothetical protein
VLVAGVSFAGFGLDAALGAGEAAGVASSWKFAVALIETPVKKARTNRMERRQ